MMDWVQSHARPIVDSIIYSIVGTVVLVLAFWLIEKILPFSMQKEIEVDHNVSLGIILGAFIIGLSLIISSAIRCCGGGCCAAPPTPPAPRVGVNPPRGAASAVSVRCTVMLAATAASVNLPCGAASAVGVR